MVQQRHGPLQGFRPTAGSDVGRRSSTSYERSGRVSATATPEETATCGQWMVSTTQAAANAAKEGGFMGVGAMQVSQRERSMLDQLRSVVEG
jgi:hypothetical protein